MVFRVRVCLRSRRVEDGDVGVTTVVMIVWRAPAGNCANNRLPISSESFT